jgi:hypothetical protein
MNKQPEIAIEADSNPFADAAERLDLAALGAV